MLKVSNIVSEALAHAQQIEQTSQEKVASEQPAPQDFTSELAGNLHKVAQSLKSRANTQVTYGDIVNFVDRIAG